MRKLHKIHRLDWRVGSAGRQRGAGVIGLLVVVVIILIMVVYMGPLSQDEATKVTQAQTYMDRSRDSVCKLNIDTMRNSVRMIHLSSPGVEVTTRIMDKKGLLLHCQAKDAKYVVQNGEIYCTVHFPPPTPAPTSTPVSLAPEAAAAPEAAPGMADAATPTPTP